MKIGFNVKLVKNELALFEESINYLGSKILEIENKTTDYDYDIANHEERINALENKTGV